LGEQEEEAERRRVRGVRLVFTVVVDINIKAKIEFRIHAERANWNRFERVFDVHEWWLFFRLRGAQIFETTGGTS
tara:strand:+ start:32 stop:256 length:225 start_codon:yes stop_codon:yes gene_type:complete